MRLLPTSRGPLAAPVILAEYVAQVGAGPADVFLQYGVLGAVLLVALGAVRILFQREVQALDLERKRADRLEAELAKVNETVATRYVALADATKVLGEAIDVIRGDR